MTKFNCPNMNHGHSNTMSLGGIEILCPPICFFSSLHLPDVPLQISFSLKSCPAIVTYPTARAQRNEAAIDEIFSDVGVVNHHCCTPAVPRTPAPPRLTIPMLPDG